MTRYCKSCGSESKTQIPLFIPFIAAFFERSTFLSFYIGQTYIPTDTPDHFTPLRTCTAWGNNNCNEAEASMHAQLLENQIWESHTTPICKTHI